MDYELPQFAPLSRDPDLGIFAELASMVRERLSISLKLQHYARNIPPEGFFTWEAAREHLESLDGGTLGSGAEEIGRSVLVGVSGGADSMALLVLTSLCRYRDPNLIVTACHVNHKLRGKESDLDAEFCEKFANSALGVNFVQAVANDVLADSFKKRGSEERLREYRYSVFQSEAQRAGAQILAVAHTLNDQVETVLFRSFRGTSTSGMRGIPCVRWHHGALISRPLIDVSRANIIALLEHLGLTWREDSSNSQLHYVRNFIRAEILPRIESQFPDFGERIENMRELISDDEEFLTSLCQTSIYELEADDFNKWSLEKLQILPKALKRRVLAHSLRIRGIEVSFERVNLLVKLSNNTDDSFNALSLNERWDATVSDMFLTFVDKDELPGENTRACAEPIEVRIPGMTIIAPMNKVIFVEELEDGATKPRRFPTEFEFEAIVSLKNVNGPLVVRERQSGDCIQPFGMREMVKLKKYLHTHKSGEAPAADMRNVFVVACEDEVLWIPGVGLSEKLRVTDSATHSLKLLEITVGDTAFV